MLEKKSTLTLRKEGHRSPFLVNCMTYVYSITRKLSSYVCPCTLRYVNEHRQQTAGDRHATDEYPSQGGSSNTPRHFMMIENPVMD